MKNLEKTLRALTAGLLMTSITGCASLPNPTPGEFPEKVTVGFPSLSAIMLLDGGSLQTQPLYRENGEQYGFSITKKHWLFGEVATQKISVPENAKNIGMKAYTNPFNTNYWISYEVGEEKYMEHYKMSTNARKCKFSEKYLWDKGKGGENWLRLKPKRLR
ncbi:MAG: hypothetical protein KKA64_04295 [Nanoarchaeota archaeon]|nr:hypothetical protein [Nanoarchaeota archaeon]